MTRSPWGCIADHGFEENEHRYYQAAQRTLADLRSSTEKFSTERFNPEPQIANQEAPTP